MSVTNTNPAFLVYPVQVKYPAIHPLHFSYPASRCRSVAFMTYEHGRCSSPATTSTTKATTQSTPPPSPPPPALIHTTATPPFNTTKVLPTRSHIQSQSQSALSEPRQTLYPRIEPYFIKHLKVTSLHTVYYEISGNPKGLPVCFIHGGPGGGTEPAHRRFFDPAIYKIVLIDQRGCGRSTPYASLIENTTWDLVADMESIRKDANIDRWILFGGSWGSTLAITYAQEYPNHVLGLILRGIFASRKEEIRWLYEREGIALLYPEAFEKYVDGLPKDLRNEESLICAYYKILSQEENSEERKIAANAWTQWECILSTFPREGNDIIKPHNIFNVHNNDENYDQLNHEDHNMIIGGVDSGHDLFDYGSDSNLAFARLENHYFINGSFYKTDGMLLSDERMKRIEHIKTCIVQGRWDFVCPRKTAYELASKFKPQNVQTYIIDSAGHSTFEPGIEQTLLKATAEFGREFSSKKYNIVESIADDHDDGSNEKMKDQ